MSSGEAVNLPLAPGQSPLAWQIRAVQAIKREMRAGKKRILTMAATGCHARGQLVMLADGRCKAVEDVVVGDTLMGPDSTPRNVLSLVRGRDEMFRITPVKGDSWVVNGDHILSLTDTRSKKAHDYVDVSVRDWLRWGPNAKHLHKQARLLPAGRELLDFSVAPVGVDDYFGFTVDGDRRYLLDDFTVTHNCGKGSLAAGLIVAAHNATKRSLFIVNRDELINDVMERALEINPRLLCGKVKGPQNEIDRRVVFASAQTLQGERLNDIGHFDYLFVDEAHFAATPTWSAIIERVRAVNPHATILGFTATPYRTGSAGGTKGLGQSFDVLASSYPLEEAIRDGVLSPLICKAIDTHLDFTGIDPDDEKKLARLVDTPERNATVVDTYLAERAGKQGIAFCCSIQHAKNLAKAFTDKGVTASWVSGDDPQREEKIRAFKQGRTTVLCNRDLLTYGFDHRPLEVVMLVRPTTSLLMFTQMVGRGTRRSPGKESGLILDFVANSAGLGLASIADLSTPPPHVRITVGAVVRHRRDDALDNGVVLSIGENDTAEVTWQGAEEQDGFFPTKDLVLLREPRAPEVLTLTPAVLGTSTFTVELFGPETGKRIGWYTYESQTYGKVKLARGKNESAMLVPDEPRSQHWTCYHLARGGPENRTSATPVKKGRYHECESAACDLIREPQNWNKDWIADPATQRQMDALRKFRIRRDKLSKGEAAVLLDVKIGLAAVFPRNH